MLLCGGDQVLFGLYSVAIILLLIGGCLWGKGQDSSDEAKLTAGIILFMFGVTFAVFAVLVNIFKGCRKIRKKRREAKAVPVLKDIEHLNIIGSQNQNGNVRKEDKGKSMKFNSLSQNQNGNHATKKSRPNNISASNDSPFTPSTNSKEPIIYRMNDYKIPNSNGNLPKFYSNSAFESEKVASTPRKTPAKHSQTSSENAAKNYSRSLFNAHAAGKL